MRDAVFITCAVTGGVALGTNSTKVPVTPQEIAAAAVEAAAAGAAVVHIHVRDPETGAPSRDVALYREVVERIRAADQAVIINLTAGMGGDVVLGQGEQPLPLSPETDVVGPAERLAHVVELRPDICTIDCGTLNFASPSADFVLLNPPQAVRAMAETVRELGVKPELEIFDTGDLVLARELIADGLIADPPLMQLCMGIPYGMPDHPLNAIALRAQVPERAVVSMFSIGRMQLPVAAAAPYLDANVRVGLEDNLYLERGVLATNADLVERAVSVLGAINVAIKDPSQVREELGLE
jgi:uncharacterized protein (DUF849 family)